MILLNNFHWQSCYLHTNFREGYRGLIESPVTGRNNNHLQLKFKTKELVYSNACQSCTCLICKFKEEKQKVARQKWAESLRDKKQQHTLLHQVAKCSYMCLFTVCYVACCLIKQILSISFRLRSCWWDAAMKEAWNEQVQEAT